jgi:hypothetical protein
LETVLIRYFPTSLISKKESEQFELAEQLEKLRKKFKIVELRSRNLYKNRSVEKSNQRLSKSTESLKNFSTSKSKVEDNQNNHSRSKSVDMSLQDEPSKRFDDRQAMERSNNSLNSSVSSILKTSQQGYYSPRSPRSYKQVKFGNEVKATLDMTKANNEEEKAKQQNQQLIWLISIRYDTNNNKISSQSIESYEKQLSTVSYSDLIYFDIKYNKITRRIDSSYESTANDNLYNKFYVIECQKWLSRDSEDGKIERKLRVNSTLKINKL